MARIEVRKSQIDEEGKQHVDTILLKQSNETSHLALQFGLPIESNKFTHVLMEPMLSSDLSFRIFLAHPTTTIESDGAVLKKGIPHLYKDIVTTSNPVILHKEESVVFSAHVIANQVTEDLPTAAD